ncbi:Homeobox domain-containing protein [Meloidogyne graminicola]|uniref:Homeobox domain-containing protein n=1 Tax=Meloidogyne graminicola TaxID=189291 RepID=A0A8S9ZAP8_9BILA|nr:Homeobox domain-containing protein [Meloidogyne graminicola]
MPSSCSSPPPQPSIPGGSLFFLENNNNNNQIIINSSSSSTETLNPLQNLQQMPGRLDERCACLFLFLLFWEKAILNYANSLHYNYGNYAASLNTALSNYYSYTAAISNGQQHNHHLLVSTSGGGFDSLNNKKAGGRQTYNPEQKRTLEEEFRANKYVSKLQRTQLVEKTGLSDKQIKIWFQNRRMKRKKQEQGIMCGEMTQESSPNEGESSNENINRFGAMTVKSEPENGIGSSGILERQDQSCEQISDEILHNIRHNNYQQQQQFNYNHQHNNNNWQLPIQQQTFIQNNNQQQQLLLTTSSFQPTYSSSTSPSTIPSATSNTNFDISSSSSSSIVPLTYIPNNQQQFCQQYPQGMVNHYQNWYWSGAAAAAVAGQGWMQIQQNNSCNNNSEMLCRTGMSKIEEQNRD